MSKKIVYRVTFQAANQIYELYAQSVSESEMFGFIEVEDLVFGEVSQILIDPNDEKLKNEFSGVKRTYIPLHNILRIDTLEKEGIAKIHPSPTGNNNVRVLPTGMIRRNEPNPKDT
jgi:hypothetical protein